MNPFPFCKRLGPLALAGSIALISSVNAQRLALPPILEIPAPLALDSVPMADSKSAPEVKLDLPIAPGPYEPTWESIEKSYPGTPDWLREAKFGIWVHFLGEWSKAAKAAGICYGLTFHHE